MSLYMLLWKRLDALTSGHQWLEVTAFDASVLDRQIEAVATELANLGALSARTSADLASVKRALAEDAPGRPKAHEALLERIRERALNLANEVAARYEGRRIDEGEAAHAFWAPLREEYEPRSAFPETGPQIVLRVPPELVSIAGAGPLLREQVEQSVWRYIRDHGLIDPKKPSVVCADERLVKVFGKRHVALREISMFLQNVQTGRLTSR